MSSLINNSGQSRLGQDYLGVLLAAGLLYVLTVAPGPLWQDNGMAQVRVLEGDYTGELGLALAHPLFYLTARVFQFLPLASSALKTNLVSAVFASFTVANIYLLLSLLLREQPVRRIGALVGAISLALAHTFWQHAALAEVYSLSTALLTLEMVLLVHYYQTGQVRWWLGAIFFNGLECANHVLALVSLAPVLVWSLWEVRQRRLHWGWFWPALVLWMVGVLPYGYFGYQAWQGGASFPEVVHSMLFGQYQAQVLNVSLRPILLVTTLGVFILNFPTPNLWLIVAGLRGAKKVVPASLVGLLALLTVFHLLFAMRYPVRDQYTFFIITIVLLSVWLGIGAAKVLLARPRWTLITLIMAFFPPVVYAVLPWIVVCIKPDFAYPPIPYRSEARYFLWPWKTGYRGPERLVDEVFDLAGPEAIILADSTTIRPFLYAQLARGARPDVTVTESLWGEVPEARRIERLRAFLTDRQVFIVRPYVHYAPGWILKNFRLEPAGPIVRVLPESGGEATEGVGSWKRRK